jgi:hypothetical protein
MIYPRWLLLGWLESWQLVNPNQAVDQNDRSVQKVCQKTPRHTELPANLAGVLS